jgi:hypothetical protein
MINSLEYINDFLYFVFIPDESKGDDSMFYCSGVNLDRFLPITKGRHRPLSNPARRGLQLANHGVRALALEKGATPKAIKSNDCAEIVPTSNGWYRDRLLIENVHKTLPDEIINYVVLNLFEKVMNGCQLNEDIPDKLPKPEELQLYLESLCDKYGAEKR